MRQPIPYSFTKVPANIPSKYELTIYSDERKIQDAVDISSSFKDLEDSSNICKRCKLMKADNCFREISLLDTNYPYITVIKSFRELLYNILLLFDIKDGEPYEHDIDKLRMYLDTMKDENITRTKLKNMITKDLHLPLIVDEDALINRYMIILKYKDESIKPNYNVVKNGIRLARQKYPDIIQRLGVNPDIVIEDLISRYIVVIPKDMRRDFQFNTDIRQSPYTITYNRLSKLISNVSSMRQDQTSYSAEISKELASLLIDTGDSKIKKKDNYSDLNGKKGLFRQQIVSTYHSSTRTVAAQHNGNASWIIIPQVVAKKQRYPELVTEANIERLQELVNTSVAKGYQRPNKSSVYNTHNRFVSGVAYTIEPGWIIYRPIEDGDYGTFGRHPYIHKDSAVVCRFLVSRDSDDFTTRMSIANTHSTNADFDGDELNVQYPISPEAIDELRNMWRSTNQAISDVDNSPLQSLVYDTIIGSYLLSSNNVSYDEFISIVKPLLISEQAYILEDYSYLNQSYSDTIKYLNRFYRRKMRYAIDVGLLDELELTRISKLTNMKITDFEILKYYKLSIPNDVVDECTTFARTIDNDTNDVLITIMKYKDIVEHIKSKIEFGIEVESEYKHIEELLLSGTLKSLSTRCKLTNSIPGKLIISLSLPNDFKYDVEGVKINKGIMYKGTLNSKHISHKSTAIQVYLLAKRNKLNIGSFKSKTQTIYNFMDTILRTTHQYLTLFGITTGTHEFTGNFDDIINSRSIVKKYKSDFKFVTDIEINYIFRKYGGEIPNDFNYVRFTTEVKGTVVRMKDDLIKLIKRYYKPSGNILNMIKSGAKGNNSNLQDMSYIIGAQYLKGDLKYNPVLSNIDFSFLISSYAFVTDVSYIEGYSQLSRYIQSIAGAIAIILRHSALPTTNYSQRISTTRLFNVQTTYPGSTAYLDSNIGTLIEPVTFNHMMDGSGMVVDKNKVYYYHDV